MSIVHLKQGACIVNLLILFKMFLYLGKSFEVFHWGYIFGKVKLALYTKIITVKEMK